MARYTLNLYGENDEIIKTFETNHIRYGVLMKALELNDKTDKLTNAELMKGANEIVKAVFTGLTDDDLMLADMEDVMNTYKRVANTANNVQGGSSSKN